jgi:S1-C subfamily serine protease
MLLFVLALSFGEIETVTSKDFPKAVQASAVTATVRVKNVSTDTDGSGTLVGRSGAFVYILTAHHVIDRAEKLEISVYSARSYPRAEHVYKSAEVLARSSESDLALLRLVTRDALPDGLKICPPNRAPEEKKFPVLSVGCPAGGAPTCLVDVVKDRRRVRKGTQKTDVSSWETASGPAAGRSGGPLLDRGGRLIGVCSGTSEGKGYYTDLEEIHRFLKRNGVRWLYEGESK